MGLRLMLLTCALGACSPFGGGAFECSLDNQCSGGTCSDGFCAFPDSDCDSGLRYGDLSGPRAGQCVGGSMTMDDARVDVPDMMIIPDTSDGCYGSNGLATPCLATPPTAPVTVDANINTDTAPACDTDPRNAAWCVIAGSAITVGNTVTVIGSKPLVLLSTSTITINGTLDVGSHRVGGIVGAGSGVAGNCNAGTVPTNGGGGAGGSFGSLGGDAGDRSGAANTGGVPGAIVTLSAVRGGCAGQNGAGNGNGTGGRGGGAVVLIASTSISVIGTLNASGAGGNGAANMISGGGGGGSGGLVMLDAPTVTASGTIFANGGGGGQGSGNSTPGQPGADPSAGDTAAAGGLRGTVGFSSYGGSGGAGSVAAGGGGAGENGVTGQTGGGGAGGGGAGIIKLYGAASIGGGGIVSPPAT